MDDEEAHSGPPGLISPCSGVPMQVRLDGRCGLALTAGAWRRVGTVPGCWSTGGQDPCQQRGLDDHCGLALPAGMWRLSKDVPAAPVLRVAAGQQVQGHRCGPEWWFVLVSSVRKETSVRKQFWTR